MIVDDLIVLGRAVPERLGDGRITVCLGGFSPKHGFIRLYPTKVNMNIKRWSVVQVEVERNPKDTRNESWKIVGSQGGWSTLQYYVHAAGTLPEKERVPLVDSLLSDCVCDIDDARKSLGIVKANVLETRFENNAKFGQLVQAVFPGFTSGAKIKHDFPYEPRVKYRCPVCRTKDPHDQQILEWGFFRWFEKHPDKYDQVWENAKFTDPGYDLFFFVGNQVRYRNSFLVISVLRFKRRPIQQTLF